MKQIPLFDPSPQIEAHRDEIDAAVNKVIDHGQFILGPEVEDFENRATEYLGVAHAIGVNSGTDALVIALRAAGIRQGDEVIAPSFSFFATAESIGILGARPVFVDVDEETYNLDPEKIEPAITDKTKAILPVHLFGRPANMVPILDIAGRHNLKVVEDCAQSFGAENPGTGRQAGAIGLAGAYSFFPTKNLGGFGDGGLIATDDEDLALQCRKLRTHGSIKKYHNEMLGYNSRLDTLQAAVLLVKLKYLDEYNEQRRAIAERYNEQLKPVNGLRSPVLAEGHVFHQYTIRILNGKRDAVRERLTDAGIGTAVYYPIPQHKLPVYQGLYPELPITEKLAGEVLSLPMYPGLKEQVQEYIVETLVEIMNKV